MAYNPLNKLLHYRDVVKLAQKHLVPGISTYAGVHRTYIYPVYKMEYKTFMKIMNFKYLEKQIKEELKKQGKTDPSEENHIAKNQLPLFEITESPQLDI